MIIDLFWSEFSVKIFERGFSIENPLELEMVIFLNDVVFRLSGLFVEFDSIKFVRFIELYLFKRWYLECGFNI